MADPRDAPPVIVAHEFPDDGRSMIGPIPGVDDIRVDLRVRTLRHVRVIVVPEVLKVANGNPSSGATGKVPGILCVDSGRREARRIEGRLAQSQAAQKRVRGKSDHRDHREKCDPHAGTIVE